MGTLTTTIKQRLNAITNFNYIICQITHYACDTTELACDQSQKTDFNIMVFNEHFKATNKNVIIKKIDSLL